MDKRGRIRAYEMNKIKDLIVKSQVLVITLTLVVLSGCRSMGSVNLSGLYIPPQSHYVEQVERDLSDPDDTPELDDYSSPARTKASGAAELSLLVGRYIHRDGILRELGNTGPTFGVQFNSYTMNDSSLHHGWFIHWSFDHFFETNSKLFLPKFWDESFTNYMLGGGYSMRWMPSDWVQLFYHGGLAFNFLEIDTNRTNPNLTDEEATSMSISTIHRVGLNIGWGGEEFKEHWFGPSILWYWVPSPLAAFAKDKDDRENTGGSFALMFDVKWAF